MQSKNAGRCQGGPAPRGQVVDLAQTTTRLISSPNPTKLKQQVTFTATVAAVLPGTGTPTGIVHFFDSAKLLGSVPLSAASASLENSALSKGSHSITAAYGGFSSYQAGTSNAKSEYGSLNPNGHGVEAVEVFHQVLLNPASQAEYMPCLHQW